MYFIYGKIIDTNENQILIETNNIGYKGLFVSIEKLIVNNYSKLFTIEYKNDFLHTLLFFTDQRIRNLSEQILNIKNIGITSIFNIFSKYNYEQFLEILKNYDFSTLCNNCKISQTNAKNIIVNLNKKIFKQAYSTKEINVINALQKLGYKISDIYKTLNLIDKSTKEEKMILDIIKYLNNDSAK